MSAVNMAHLHLLLNHVPTVGSIVGLGLFVVAMVRRNDHLQRASLEVFFIIALLTLPAYISGVAAEASITDHPGVSTALMARHNDAALFAFLSMQIAGAVAWLGLWQCRRSARPSSRTSWAMLLLSVLTIALMGRAASIGGEIRHPEILLEPQAPPPAAKAALSSDSIAAFVVDHEWIWPVAEDLHFVGLCLLFGVVLIVNLRILGMMKSVSFAALHALLPWAMLGIGVNVLTGMLFFITAPDQYTTNVAFYWKVALLLVAGCNLLYLTVVDKVWSLKSGEDAAFGDKAFAASGMAVWLGVTYCGRMLPFLGNAA